jgi:hypothetical protein
MNRKDLEQAIEREVAEWPGASVAFAEGSKHPKAKLKFADLTIAVVYSSTPSDVRGILNTVSDVRRALKKLGAARPKPEPTPVEEEEAYRKANPGREARPDPVAGEKAKPKPDLIDQLVNGGVITETLAKDARVDAAALAPVMNGEAETARAAALEELQAQVDAIMDGIYFGLPEAIYHAVPRLSASGLQKLAVSPGTFWRGSWLDPHRPELDEDQTKAQQLGKAYHCARLEPERFERLYCRQLEKADMPKGTLFTGTDMGKALEDRGLKKSGSVGEQAQRLADDGYPNPIWHIELAAWEEANAFRLPIPGKFWDDIVSDMDRLRKNREIAELLENGVAEVSIFWTDRHGIKMKARADFLTVAHWVDFKTFDNSRGKVLEQCIADAFQYNRYHIQAVTYRDAVEAIRVGGLQIQGDANDEQRSLVAAIQMRPGELACWYIFQEKGGVPNLMAWEFPFWDVPLSVQAQHAGASEEGIAAVDSATRKRTGIHRRAAMDIDKAKRDFHTYSNVYEPGEPWQLIDAKGKLSDLMFRQGWLDGTYA